MARNSLLSALRSRDIIYLTHPYTMVTQAVLLAFKLWECHLSGINLNIGRDEDENLEDTKLLCRLSFVSIDGREINVTVFPGRSIQHT
jgi:hypothetical protein